MLLDEILVDMQLDLRDHVGGDVEVISPINGRKILTLAADNKKAVEIKINQSVEAFEIWRTVPAPKRGELVRLLGNELRENKEALGKLVTLECGKILQEGMGEVQEMIDICDFAVGLSRQVGGLTLPSERAEHVMHENWCPLGVVGVISAFNFPVAVWAWNSALAIICGNAVLWKPSEKTPITALVCQKLFERAIARFEGNVPEGLSQVIVGEREQGELLVKDRRVALVSATGSTRMGREVAPLVAKRFGKILLELGGNNAVIVTPSADLEIALPSVVFGAVGTAGQRCTSTRRAFVHRSIYEGVVEKITTAYASIDSKIGNPLQEGVVVGPLIDEMSFNAMQAALGVAQAEGATVVGGQRVQVKGNEEGFYVQPALVILNKPVEIVNKETFAPILYVMPYERLSEAIAMQNSVAQGLSSAIFTQKIEEAELFKRESDCGIANVNIGTSGAEIGGAFGGEKETGGGRESGSDAWKNYMRRQTSTTFYGVHAPDLAQGIKFNVNN